MIFLCLDNLKVDGRMNVGYDSVAGVLFFNISACLYLGHLDFMALEIIRQRFLLLLSPPVSFGDNVMYAFIWCLKSHKINCSHA